MPWSYWLCVSIFLVMFGASAFYALFSEDKKDRGVGVASCIVSLSFGAGGFLWPILRKKESKAIQAEFVHSFDMHCEAVVFPMSRVKQFFTIVGAIALSVGISTLLFFADNNENRVKGIIGLVIYICIFILGLKSLLAGRKGIFLVPNGIIWNEMFRAPCFIPWEIISETALFLKKEKNALKPIWTFGLNVFDPALFRTTRWSRKKFLQSKIQHGWYFYFFKKLSLCPSKLSQRQFSFSAKILKLVAKLEQPMLWLEFKSLRRRQFSRKVY